MQASASDIRSPYFRTSASVRSSAAVRSNGMASTPSRTISTTTDDARPSRRSRNIASEITASHVTSGAV